MPEARILRTATDNYGRRTDGLRTATDGYGRPPGMRAEYPNAAGVAPDTVALPRIPWHWPGYRGIGPDTVALARIPWHWPGYPNGTPREYWQSRLTQRLSVSGLRGLVGEGKGATDGSISTLAVRDIHRLPFS